MIDFIYETLGSIGFHHPLHPAITHLPMGMVMGGFLFALIALVLNKEALALSAHYCYTVALVFVLPTMLLGYMDWQHKFGGEWGPIILTKIILAFLLLLLLLAAFFIGKNRQASLKSKLAVYAVCLVVAIGLGFMGGQLQYG